MKKIFTEEFYNEMVKNLYNQVENDNLFDSDYEDVVNDKYICMDYEAESGEYVCCYLLFDHEFSTSAPYDRPYDETCDLIITDILDIKDVHVWAENAKGAPEVEGFDKEAFMKAVKVAA